jgi:pimeloyl-ACP methyl ester carboxylesterase
MNIPINQVITADFTMDYFRFGTGSKTMVIIPGLSIKSVMQSADMVADAYKLLAYDFTIYLFDRRKNLPQSYSICDMADDTVKAIESLNLKDIYLFGVSQGGMISQQIAIKYPNLVKKLIVGSTSSNMQGEKSKVIDGWIKLAKEKSGEELYVDFAKGDYPEDVFEQYKAEIIKIAKTVTDEEINRFIILAEGTKSFNITEDLHKIKCPMFAIGVENDEVLGVEPTKIIAEKMADNPEFELYIYDKYGHVAYDLAPDYKERIYNFFMK